MKKLIFVRHGKAEEEAPGFSDFERSLTTEGKRISKLMAKVFIKKEDSAGMIISSPAFRALETALIFAGESDTEYDQVIINSNLYYRTNLGILTDLLSEITDDINKITLFGHNPSFTEIPDSLSIDGCDFVPKSGVACISFETDTWKEIGRKTGKLEYILKPEKSL